MLWLLWCVVVGVQSVTLREAAKGRIMVGTAANRDHLRQDHTYATLLAEQYSSLTAENSCKFGPTEPSRNSFSFADCDAILNASRANGAAFRAHNLVWGVSNPAWLENGHFSPDEKRAILVNHIQTLVQHYGSAPYCWDVVNEAVTDQSGSTLFKPNIWYPDVPDYVDLAFKTARAAHPHVKLFYNDYSHASSTGWSAEKSNKVFNMIASMKNRGVPIDGVGFQLHVDLNYRSMVEGVKENIKRYQGIGIEVHMTEIDVSCASYGSSCTSWDGQKEQEQAAVYSALLDACLSFSNCKSFTSWGFTDKYTWLPGQHPLPFDENFKPKLAFGALIDTFNNHTTSNTP
eukprot:TRINITY_DN1363_c0_g2_i1.p1 TRINITY_DN1363_c0_g2~~TRINITY_DN1363_c0_g2_i1.p1  ORF type:complete len:345 (-),score=28.77 TRINITY_DN1363_c0_g2_i1:53-1087(-)